MKKWKQLTLAIAATVGVASLAVPAHDTLAIDVFDGCKSNGSVVCKESKDEDAAPSMAKTVVNTLLLVLGMVAVVMIIIGGIRYATSGGDSSHVKSAKDTILYSVIGLVVAILAFTIVNFVLGSF